MSDALRQADSVIGGIPCDGRATVVRWNPSTGEPFVSIGQATEADVARAVAAARDAAPLMGELSPAHRATSLARAADTLSTHVDEWAMDMAEEMGKPISEALVECRRAVDVLRYHSQQVTAPLGEQFAAAATGSPIYTLRQPLGAVGLIAPWNFPAALPAWKLAPALAAGNSTVLKLSSAGALTGLRLVSALLDTDLPVGAVNVLLGDDPNIGRGLVSHPDIDAVSFTGSVRVGREVIGVASARGARVQAEMGGHAPLVVMADAELSDAVEAAATGAFASAGQKCTSTRRAYVASSRYEEFLDGLVARVSDMSTGPARDPATQLGPLVDAGARDRVLGAVREAASQGRLRFGGDVPSTPETAGGAYLTPAIVTDLPAEAPLATREVFGPALAVWPFDDEEDPVMLANRTEYGLAAAIFTNDLSVAERFVRRVDAGLVHVNSQTAGADVHVPFGGHSGSGFGTREQGREAYAFFTEDRTVYVDQAR